MATFSHQFWEVRDKYLQTKVAAVELITDLEISNRIQLAKKEWSRFKKSSGERRSELLRALRKKVEDNKEELRDLIIVEAGKPLSYSEAEINRCITTIKWAEEEALRFCGEIIPMEYGVGVGKKAMTKPFSIGIILGISPFNFPLNLSLHKIAPAIASGNVILMKPSPHTPLSLIRLQELAMEAGWPEGLFQVLPINDEQCEKLIQHDEVKMLSFTGSPKVGWMLKKLVPKKKVTLELGGNAAVIIEDCRGLKKIVEEVAVGAFLYSGQICISTQRIYVNQNIYQEFKEELIKVIYNLKCGDPKSNDTIVGPIIDSIHAEKTLKRVKESKGTILVGGKFIDKEKNLFAPTLIENPDPKSDVICEEAFAPIATIESYQNIFQAIEFVNDSRFGLQTGIYTDSKEIIDIAFREIESGAVIVGGVPGMRVDHMPYGGIKDSGFGKEGIIYAMKEMSDFKLLVW